MLADGFEEIEAITPIDILRRSGAEVTVAGVGKRSITGSHGIKVEADTLLEDYKEIPDAVVLPGGMPGAENLRKSKALEILLKKMKESDKVIGAICASPAVVLSGHGLLHGKKATCYPGFEGQLHSSVIQKTAERVVVDGKITTSKGPGTALEFALELVSQLVSPEKSKELSRQLIVS